MSQMLATSVEVRRRSPIWFWVNTVLAVLILVPAGIGFGMKFRELVLLYESYLSQREKEGGWAQPGPMPAAAPPPAPVAVTAPEADGVVPAQPGVVGMVREVGRSSRRQYTETEASDGGFAVAPILNYLLVSLGFFLLFLAAIFHGMFRDIEQPKRDMLAQEQFLDRIEAERGAPTVADVAGRRPDALAAAVPLEV